MTASEMRTALAGLVDDADEGKTPQQVIERMETFPAGRELLGMSLLDLLRQINVRTLLELCDKART